MGDICHTVPVVRTLQKAWPHTRLTWVIGKLEHTLVGDIPDIEFIIFDKQAGLQAYRQLWQQMRGRHYDVLLHMQMALRASLASILIPADIRLGFDRQRARDLQWLFTNHRIAHRERQHVMDSLFGFPEALGITERELRWDIPIPDEVRHEVNAWLPDKPYLVISPCSSKAYRNWTSEGYAAVADHAAEKHGLAVVLTGGPSEIEQHYGREISSRCKNKPVNLIGKTSLKQLLAILDRAKLVIAPDSGPAHMATAVNTPVIGLYAATNPERAGPYLSGDLLVNRYPDAIVREIHHEARNLAWDRRVKEPEIMHLVSVADVINKLDTAFGSDNY